MKSLAACLLFLAILSAGSAAAPMKALIVDGQNNHDWKASTPQLQQILEGTGRFTVEVATTPPKGDRMTFCSR